MASQPVRIECDRVRIRAPERFRDRTRSGEERAAPYTLAVGSLTILAREDPPELAFGGEELILWAEGIVKIVRTGGRIATEEGPYRTLLWRNGRMLLR